MSRHDDGYESIKLVMVDDYELGEDEHYLDDLEDTVDDEEDSEYGLRNDDDEANEGREDDDETSEGPQEDNIEIEANERDPETRNGRRSRGLRGIGE